MSWEGASPDGYGRAPVIQQRISGRVVGCPQLRYPVEIKVSADEAYRFPHLNKGISQRIDDPAAAMELGRAHSTRLIDADHICDVLDGAGRSDALEDERAPGLPRHREDQHPGASVGQVRAEPGKGQVVAAAQGEDAVGRQDEMVSWRENDAFCLH